MNKVYLVWKVIKGSGYDSELVGIWTDKESALAQMRSIDEIFLVCVEETIINQPWLTVTEIIYSDDIKKEVE